jgi:uncharacterized protein (DUF983 family)
MFGTVKCPNCSAPISSGLVQPLFKCQACGTELRANTAIATVAAIVIGGIPLGIASAIGSVWALVIGVLITLGLTVAIWCSSLKIAAVGKQ